MKKFIVIAFFIQDVNLIRTLSSKIKKKIIYICVFIKLQLVFPFYSNMSTQHW
jgi:hypothetical protein